MKIRLSKKERNRVRVLGQVKLGKVSLKKAGELLGVSYRQVRRIYQRYTREGVEGLKHGLRDRRSNHQIGSSHRERILKLYEAKYGDFGPTLAVEYLRKEDGEEVGVETLRRWLVAAGLWASRQARGVHRKWRERKHYVGEMVQMDGSEHDWFEGRRGRGVLMVMIDDATNRTYARFFEGETTAAAMTVFWEWVRLYGIPHSLYVDRDSIYETTRDSTVDETLANQAPLTQFGRAMQELGVELILAHSPQAKGRVERRNQVFQDRLVKGMRLKGICTMEAGNAYLDDDFLPDMNATFTVAAAEKGDLHHRVGRGVKLAHVLCNQEERVVQNDWTVSWRNRYFQVSAIHRRLSLAKRKITVSELLDGTIRLTYRDRELQWKELPERPGPGAKRKGTTSPVSPEKKAGGKKAPWKPGKKHPWRRPGRVT